MASDTPWLCHGVRSINSYALPLPFYLYTCMIIQTLNFNVMFVTIRASFLAKKNLVCLFIYFYSHTLLATYLRRTLANNFHRVRLSGKYIKWNIKGPVYMLRRGS